MGKYLVYRYNAMFGHKNPFLQAVGYILLTISQKKRKIARKDQPPARAAAL
jgi:hypothetical protein